MVSVNYIIVDAMSALPVTYSLFSILFMPKVWSLNQSMLSFLIEIKVCIRQYPISAKLLTERFSYSKYYFVFFFLRVHDVQMWTFLSFSSSCVYAHDVRTYVKKVQKGEKKKIYKKLFLMEYPQRLEKAKIFR